MVTTIEERDFNFTKVWLQSFLPQLRLIGNKKIDVCMWIIEHLNRDNQLIATYKQIAEATDASMDTVSKTMQCLVDNNFMRRESLGCYRINPDITLQGRQAGATKCVVLVQNCKWKQQRAHKCRFEGKT